MTRSFTRTLGAAALLALGCWSAVVPATAATHPVRNWQAFTHGEEAGITASVDENSMVRKGQTIAVTIMVDNTGQDWPWKSSIGDLIVDYSERTITRIAEANFTRFHCVTGGQR